GSSRALAADLLMVICAQRLVSLKGDRLAPVTGSGPCGSRFSGAASIHAAPTPVHPGKAVVSDIGSILAGRDTAPGRNYSRQRNSESPPPAAHTADLSESQFRCACHGVPS